MDWMRPSRTNELPEDDNWEYEIKYDGYRACLAWDGKEARLHSKGGHNLIQLFPEIAQTMESCFPHNVSVQLDGELTILENEGRSDFYQLQRRHRLRSERTILKEANLRPASFLAFDCFTLHEENMTHYPWIKRKQELRELLETIGLPLHPHPHHKKRVQFIPSYSSQEDIAEKNRVCRGEGIVAKKKNSHYEKGKTSSWLKMKTPFHTPSFITKYDPSNHYFHLGVMSGNTTLPIGKCAHGLSPEESEALIHTIKRNGSWDAKEKVYTIDPSLVVEVTYTTRKEKELREPRFSRFLFDVPAVQCTKETLLLSDLRFPEEVEITHPDKPLWPNHQLQKIDFLRYVRHVAPYVLPFLKDRLLTVIRYPHGIFEEGFYQKDCPDYAPDFVETYFDDDNHFILCNTSKTLLWLANQLAIEWHTPFQRYHSTFVDEIVFDLDPPDTSYFSLAIKGALLVKELCDSFHIVSFVKFSGNKGLQIHIPLPDETYTWDDTNKITEAFGAFLTEKHPALFTQERLKKNRGKKLYIDIPQHRKGKTIIAPYSLRGKELPLVACPLEWEEVDSHLDRELFTTEYVLQRLLVRGCPFSEMTHVKDNQPIDELLQVLNNV
ncbi:DNA ligase D [Alteribacillus iranensis]|uniref:Bifunctional non-homologous end joining protein LigD n=1 Tax=Alteribacillus iranensis TaxID=930128 RepID=A0A1I2DMX5_9BACI|nr:DNA ligase D [Alteribacillus iranensis]SFE81250.1 bifunctional non-homologous end joining protein LigD [Alteribacillus iranensis]